MGVTQTLVMVSIDVLVVRACFRGIVGLEVPFAFVIDVSIMIVEPERVVSVWITVVGDGVAKALKLIDSVMVSDVFVMVTNISSSEIPHGCDNLLL